MPHAGGVYDQPAEVVKLYFAYLSYIAKEEKAEMDRQKRIRRMEESGLVTSPYD